MSKGELGQLLRGAALRLRVDVGLDLRRDPARAALGVPGSRREWWSGTIALGAAVPVDLEGSTVMVVEIARRLQREIPTARC